MPTFQVLEGHWLNKAKELANRSIHVCVTSPPYWGLRDYKTEPQVWGGQSDCEHEWGSLLPPKPGRGNKIGDFSTSSLTNPQRQDSVERAFNSGAFCSCGAWRGELGQEPTPLLYIDHLVEVFREVKRVLRDDGTLWINIGDCYATGAGSVGEHPGGGAQGAKWAGQHPGRMRQNGTGGNGANVGPAIQMNRLPIAGRKAGDLVGIPWLLAFALQADGWTLRRDVIWCLSGGTWLYARTQKGDMPIMVRDLARLRDGTIQLWNGTKWTNLLGMSKSRRQGDEITFTLRSGERISCTPTHRFPATRGLLPASEIRNGDCLVHVQLPEPCSPRRPQHVTNDAAWFAGLYIAEGSMSGDIIQIAGHAKESERWLRVCRIAADYGGSATRTIKGNKMDIRVSGKLLVALLRELVSGRTAKNKCFAPVVWRYGNDFIAEAMNGYLSGDAHDDTPNHRYRLGFKRNYNWERDIRTACARLGYTLTLKMGVASFDGRQFPIFRGELRKVRSGHPNEKDRGEVARIEKARCREVYDLGVEDEPHLFALASGVLTHNSKVNCMPESVYGTRWEKHRIKTKQGDWPSRYGGSAGVPNTEHRNGTEWADCPGCKKCEPNDGLVLRRGSGRPTTAHEYIFMLTKTGDYFYDSDAIAEKSTGQNGAAASFKRETKDHVIPGQSVAQHRADRTDREDSGTRNKRSVWTITSQPYTEDHFAAFPEELPEICIKASTSERGVCAECGAPWARVVERELGGEKKIQTGPRPAADERGVSSTSGLRTNGRTTWEANTRGWRATCNCNAGELIPATVLDPFLGRGTTGTVAVRLGRNFKGCDLQPNYITMSRKNINNEAPLFVKETIT